MDDRSEQVIVVDENDIEVGFMGKLEAHEGDGTLHRAFSIFLFDRNGRLLLQRRASEKYHFGGLWANSCCGHPRPGETVIEAGERRLREEIGIRAALREVASFHYSAEDPGSGYTEREIDHVLVGESDDPVDLDANEVSEVRQINVEALRRELEECPRSFVPWLAPAMEILRR